MKAQQFLLAVAILLVLNLNHDACGEETGVEGEVNHLLRPLHVLREFFPFLLSHQVPVFFK